MRSLVPLSVAGTGDLRPIPESGNLDGEPPFIQRLQILMKEVEKKPW